MFCNTLILWNFVIFGAEPLLNVLKTTTKGRSLGGGTIYMSVYTYLYIISQITWNHASPIGRIFPLFGGLTGGWILGAPSYFGAERIAWEPNTP